VDEARLQAVRGAVFVAALALGVLLQRLTPHARLRGSWLVNGSLAAINAAVLGVACGACGITAARWAAHARIGVLHWTGAPAWAAIPFSIAGLDLVSYGWHRATHRVPLLWRFHQVHHSDPSFTVSTGLRFHPGELLLSLPLRLSAVAVPGAPAAAVLVFEGVFTVANLVEHGDIAMPRRMEDALGRVVVTPALHRCHHTRSGAARDTNFGTILSVWDRWFATRTGCDSTVRVQTGLRGIPALGLGRALALPLSQRPE